MLDVDNVSISHECNKPQVENFAKKALITLIMAD